MKGDNSLLWIIHWTIIFGNNLWFTATDSDVTRVTVSYGPFPSEWEKPLCSSIRCTDGCLPPQYLSVLSIHVLFLYLLLWHFQSVHSKAALLEHIPQLWLLAPHFHTGTYGAIMIISLSHDWTLCSSERGCTVQVMVGDTNKAFIV